MTFCDSSNDDLSVCEIQDPARDVGFVRIGRYRKEFLYPSIYISIQSSSFLGGFTDKGSEYQKTYLIPKYLRTNWLKAKSICKSFDLDLASFETLEEAENFLFIAKNNPFVHELWAIHLLVDGMTSTVNTSIDWYWTSSGNKVSYPLPWQKGAPDFLGGVEYCLAFSANEPSTIGFNDFSCDSSVSPFVCQRIDYFVPARSN